MFSPATDMVIIERILQDANVPYIKDAKYRESEVVVPGRRRYWHIYVEYSQGDMCKNFMDIFFTKDGDLWPG